MEINEKVRTFIVKRIRSFPDQAKFIEHQDAKILSMKHQLTLLRQVVDKRKSFKTKNNYQQKLNNEKLKHAEDSLLIMQRSIDLRAQATDYVKSFSPQEWEELKKEAGNG